MKVKPRLYALAGGEREPLNLKRKEEATRSFAEWEAVAIVVVWRREEGNVFRRGGVRGRDKKPLGTREKSGPSTKGGITLCLSRDGWESVEGKGKDMAPPGRLYRKASWKKTRVPVGKDNLGNTVLYEQVWTECNCTPARNSVSS